MFFPKVYLLLPKHVAEKITNCRKLHGKHLTTDKWKLAVTHEGIFK